MNALTESARAFIPRARERSRYERFHPLGAPDAEQVTECPREQWAEAHHRPAQPSISHGKAGDGIDRSGALYLVPQRGQIGVSPTPRVQKELPTLSHMGKRPTFTAHNKGKIAHVVSQ